MRHYYPHRNYYHAMASVATSIVLMLSALPLAHASTLQESPLVHFTRYREGYPMVAIGDSTMALAPTAVKKVDSILGKCQRNVKTWPQQVAERQRLELADLSCGGTTSLSYWKLGNALDVLGRKTQLVVVSYGSNDMRVYPQMVRDNLWFGTAPYLHHPAQSLVEENLVRVLKDIRHRAPNATIMTVGYLPLVEGLQCRQLPHMTRIEMARMAMLRQQADNALSHATMRASLSRHGDKIIHDRLMYNLPLVNVSGHSLCSVTSQRFILHHEIIGQHYHYTMRGVRFVASAVNWKLAHI